MSALQVTSQYRTASGRLQLITIAALTALAPLLDFRNIDRSFAGWLLAVEQVVNRNRVAAARNAEQYLQEFRSAMGVPGAGLVVPAGPVNHDQLTTRMASVTVAQIKRSTGANKRPELIMRDAVAVSAANAANLVQDAGRETVMDSATADPDTEGWQRVTRLGGCPFCVMLADRGDVYLTGDSASFGSHPGCQCSVEPAYGGKRRVVRDYEKSVRNIPEDERNRLRLYLKRNYPSSK